MNKLTELYDAIHMPDALEAKILSAKPARKPKFRPATAIAAVLAVVLMLGVSPTVRAAVSEWVTISFPSLDLTIEQRITENAVEEVRVVVDTEAPAYAHMEDGRLYFTGNGENIDITDEITEEEPFFYTYTDGRGYEINLVVGYAETIENFGTYEFIKENGQWFTGSGRNFLDMEIETAYPWVQVVWDTLDIPWPMPGE